MKEERVSKGDLILIFALMFIISLVLIHNTSSINEITDEREFRFCMDSTINLRNGEICCFEDRECTFTYPLLYSEMNDIFGMIEFKLKTGGG